MIKIDDPTIPARIDTLRNNGMVNTWEQNFLDSIKVSFDKYKSLTQGQFNTLVGIEARYSPDEIAARNAWRASWDSVKANNWKSCMEYYVKTPYYKGATDKWLKDPDWIPGEKDYRAICENKYSQKFLKNRDIPAKFKQGALVVYKRYGTYKLATIIEVKEVKDWTKGSRGYDISVIGETGIQLAYEKELLYYREGMLNKIEKPEEEMPF